MQGEQVPPVQVDEATLRALMPRVISVLKDMNDRRLLLRPESVAELVDIPVRTLRDLIAKEQFPPADKVLTNKLKFWKRETVLDWIENNPAK